MLLCAKAIQGEIGGNSVLVPTGSRLSLPFDTRFLLYRVPSFLFRNFLTYIYIYGVCVDQAIRIRSKVFRRFVFCTSLLGFSFGSRIEGKNSMVLMILFRSPYHFVSCGY